MVTIQEKTGRIGNDQIDAIQDTHPLLHTFLGSNPTIETENNGGKTVSFLVRNFKRPGPFGDPNEPESYGKERIPAYDNRLTGSIFPEKEFRSKPLGDLIDKVHEVLSTRNNYT